MAKRELFIWKRNHEILLLREVVFQEPYKFNPGTKERGGTWSKVAEKLTQQGMKVNQRSVREKFDKLYSEFKDRERQERTASGIEVEYDEVMQALTEIHERILEYEESRQARESQDKISAEEMRRRATEKLSDTKKRKEDESDDETSPKKRRKSHVNLVDMLRESIDRKKVEQEKQQEMRKRELDQREAELQQQQLFQNMLLQQQQQFQQQQQSMNMAMLNLMKELFQHIQK